MSNEPRDHHYVPQFFLRNFTIDPEQKKITTVAKHGHVAVWTARSIERLGFERDFYVHLRGGTPVSVETAINSRIETPISQSDTWTKIISGKAECLDRSDKPILYALIRHLEARTPHYLATRAELANLAADPDSQIPFTQEEREMYALTRSDPNLAKRLFDLMSSTLEWTERNFRGSGLSIIRSPIPLRSSTTPVLAIRAESHPASWQPLPGMIPFQLILTLNRYTAASLVLGDFDDGFVNNEVDANVAMGLNRHFVGQFSYFGNTRHLITDRIEIDKDMAWAQYDLISDTEKKIVYRRRV